MPISQTDALFHLIKSLTKAEKRHFRLYAKRNQAADSLKFIELFDLIDKHKGGEEKSVFNRLSGLTKSQYANLKRHLYSQIMTSLRLVHKKKRANIQVREYIDFAYILYGKGLFLQALQVLKMAKSQAIKNQLNYAHLTIVEIEKLIETRQITRSGEERALALIDEANSITHRVSDIVYLSNLRMELHSLYLKNGHSRSKEDKFELRKQFDPKFIALKKVELGVIEQIYYYQSLVWYSYIQLDFEACREHAIKWVQTLSENPAMIHRDVDLYFRGYHYILSSCFHLRDLQGLSHYLEQLEHYRKSNYQKLNTNSQIIAFQYVHTGRLNQVILEGDFEKGLTLIPRTLKRINRYRRILDDHKILVFYFKMAWIYFGAGNYNKAIYYLNRVVNKEMMNLREDLQIYSRLLFLMCHYELENYDILNYLHKSFQSFINRVRDTYPMQIVTQEMFREISKAPLIEHHEIMGKSLTKLNALKADPFQRTSFTYLDITTWLESKIQKKELSDIIKEMVD